MKVSVSTYSFNKMLCEGKITQFDCIAKSKELGFDAIEFVDIIPHDGSTKQEYAKKLNKECERLNMPISNFTFGADFLNGSDGNFEAEIERIKSMIDLAELVGAKSVRHDATVGYSKEIRKYQGFDDVLPKLADGCRQITQYAKTKKIKTMVENHGFFCQDSDRVEKLVNRVADENFGLLVDMGNFLCADEDPAIAVSRVAPYAFYAHAKDFHIKSCMEPNPGEGFFRTRNGNYLRGAIIGQGNVPVKHCLTALKQAGYDDYIAIEFEGIEENIMALKIGLCNLKRYISEI